MNNKNIIGNGSKATLPGGQKLSDKIQENKTKQGVNNNISGKPSNFPSGDNSNNKKEENGEEKKKSKVDNVASQVGSEALKKTLKTAFPYIPQFIINKLVDSKLGQEVIEKQLNKTKKKIIFGLLGTLATGLMHMFLICAIVAAILSPVAGIKDALDKAGKFFTSVWNIFKYGEYCASDEECQEKLSIKYYDKLDSTVEKYFGDCEETDVEHIKNLITATIFYDQMIYDVNYSEYGESNDQETNTDQENTTDNSDQTNTDDSDEEQNEDAEDNALSEVEGGYFDYRGKRKKIEPLVKKLKSGDSCVVNSYAYRQHLTNTYVEKNYAYVLVEHYKDGVEGKLTIDKVVDEIMTIGGFESLGSNGSCSSSCVYNVNGQVVNDIKVRLINGVNSDNPGSPIEGEELVPFEKYILGVVYGEIGSGAPDEAMKAQAIAARSYALRRPGNMGGHLGRSLKEEDGQWILTIVNSTEDQVYCDPDRGCSKIGGANSVLYSDPDKYNFYMGPLPADARIRSVVSEVAGKVALDAEGNIISTGYVSSDQREWIAQAESGMDYTAILREKYSDYSVIGDGNCSALCSSASGPYTEWKQYNWPDVYMNSLSLKEAGCLTVSVCMQVARSGVETPLGADFNPGTLVNEYRSYLYNGNDQWTWYGITKVIPKFKYDSKYEMQNMQYMTYEEQQTKLLEGINAGCYYVVEVKRYHSGQHWVAIDTIKDGEIYILDPSSNCKVLSECKAREGFSYRINTAQCYRVVE